MLFKKIKTATTTQELIDAANTSLFSLEPDSEEYDKVIKQIERLHKLKSLEKEGKQVSPDTLAIVITNLVGIMLILNFERLGVLSSKAAGFVMKTKM